MGPTHHNILRGKRTTRKLGAKLKTRYNLQCDGGAYPVEIINDEVVCITMMILDSKIFKNNYTN